MANAASNLLPALTPSRRLGLLGFRVTRAGTIGDLSRNTQAHAEARAGGAFGGSLANRARLARDIGRAVRDVVGRRLAITAKLNMDDGVSGGSLCLGRLMACTFTCAADAQPPPTRQFR